MDCARSEPAPSTTKEVRHTLPHLFNSKVAGSDLLPSPCPSLDHGPTQGQLPREAVGLELRCLACERRTLRSRDAMAARSTSLSGLARQHVPESQGNEPLGIHSEANHPPGPRREGTYV
ncbi:MAG: hypothetical protein ACI9K5_002790 [Gammaproteobacteria bacterium]|jgi:hypothetical protein